ncbi:hypothetical protein GWI33_005600 [Rhynchophorus ferrugineus]|uniref:Uncharacterized protein n=1 Tax=Rhynchophorus ferrugineus TaxID=354439 RepID=A0A834MDK5_RHYFE|nr:hypothetical protein GWI33_005600 [Rhynchophorus ferrugineus]
MSITAFPSVQLFQRESAPFSLGDAFFYVQLSLWPTVKSRFPGYSRDNKGPIWVPRRGLFRGPAVGCARSLIVLFGLSDFGADVPVRLGDKNDGIWEWPPDKN